MNEIVESTRAPLTWPREKLLMGLSLREYARGLVTPFDIEAAVLRAQEFYNNPPIVPAHMPFSLNRMLNSTLRAAGVTFVAPVPACTLEIWRLVGGKNALPWSHGSTTRDSKAASPR